MSVILPDAIDEYFRAKNAHDTAAIAACFADDAVVHDEGEELRGRTAITKWIEETTAKYKVAVEILKAEEQGREVVVTGLVSGTFDGSPIELQFCFTMVAGKIVGLAVR